MYRGRGRLTYHGRQSGRRMESEQMTLSDKAGQSDLCSSGNIRGKHLARELQSKALFS